MFEHFPISAKDFDGPVLVTGAGGCIGSWTLALLDHAGVKVHAFDLQVDQRRPSLLMDAAALQRIIFSNHPRMLLFHAAEIVFSRFSWQMQQHFAVVLAAGERVLLKFGVIFFVR